MVVIPEGWIDRDKARAVPFPEVLSALGLLDRLKTKGSNLQGSCPIGKEHGKADCFGVEIGAKQAFNCFACKKKGTYIIISYNLLRRCMEQCFCREGRFSRFRWMDKFGLALFNFRLL